MNGKPAIINGLRKLRNPPSWVVIFAVVPFNESPLFPENVIVFTIYFTVSFGRVIPEPVIYSLLNLSIFLSRNLFLKYLAKSIPFKQHSIKYFQK